MPIPKFRLGNVESFEDAEYNFGAMKKELLYVLRNLDEDNLDRFHRGVGTFAVPMLMEEGVVESGRYGKTSSTTPVRFNAITYVHTGIFLVCVVFACVESPGATCTVQLVDGPLGGPYRVLAEIKTKEVKEKRYTLTAPIGQPTVEVRDLYILFKTSDANNPAYVRSTIAYLE